jgi:type IV pilus assembly protein PilQ
MKIILAFNSNFVARKLRGAVYGLLLLLTFFIPQFAKTQDQLNAAKSAHAVKNSDIASEQNPVSASSGKSQDAYSAAIAPDSSAMSPPNVEGAADVIAHDIPQPALVAALSSMILSPAEAPMRETVRFSPVPDFEEARQAIAHTAPQPVQVAAVITRSVLPAAQSAPPAGSRFTGEYIDADFMNVPLVDFFRMIGDVGGINVMLDQGISGNTTFKVEKVHWDELLDMVLLNHGLTKTMEGNIVRIVLKKTLQDEANQEKALKDASMLAGELDTRIKRLNYAKASDLNNLVTKQITARGIVVVDDRTNSLVLTDLPDSLDRLFRLINELDISQSQVEIETRIVAATRNFARDIGVQFGFVQGNSQRVTVGGSNATYLQTGNGANRPMGPTSSSSDSPGVSTGSGDANGNLNVNLPARTPFGGIGIAVGNFLDTFLLDAAITAGESKGTAKMIAQPKVVVQNNAPALITNGVRFPVQVITDNTVTIQFFDAALTLTVTPQITYEGNIMLDLDVANNIADFSQQVNGVPTIRTRETKTNVLVSDGGTMVLGGIIVEDDSTNEDRIPGLSNLPILGHLFRRNANNRESQEIMFIVTPRILR